MTPDEAAQAACASEDPDLFFHEISSLTVKRAKAVCMQCPVRLPCLEEALANRSVQGIWGGTTDKERRRMRKAS